MRYTQQDSLDEAGGESFDGIPRIFTNSMLGGNLNAASRQALMQKLARIEPAPKPQPVYVHSTKLSAYFTLICSNKPNIPQAMQSRSILLKNMFNPEE